MQLKLKEEAYNLLASQNPASDRAPELRLFLRKLQVHLNDTPNLYILLLTNTLVLE